MALQAKRMFCVYSVTVPAITPASPHPRREPYELRGVYGFRDDACNHKNDCDGMLSEQTCFYDLETNTVFAWCPKKNDNIEVPAETNLVEHRQKLRKAVYDKLSPEERELLGVVP